MVGERPRTGGISSGWVKPPRTSLVPSTEQQSHRWGEISTQSPKDIKRQHPPRPQSLHLAAIWQKIQKCPLPCHQATGQLLLFFYLFFLLCSMEGLNSVQFLQPWHRKMTNKWTFTSSNALYAMSDCGKATQISVWSGSGASLCYKRE